MSRLELRIPPDLVWLAAAGLVLLTATATPRLHVSLAWRGPAAAVLIGAGVVLIAAARAALARADTTFSPVAPARSSSLVTTGVYRFTRNPMYAGMTIALVALAVLLSSPGAVALSVAFVAYIDRFQVRPEERVLRVLFGADYDAYRARVRRWV
jgi:protein-S-isoprenylcysteine O-methyltransferase Ste14